MQRVVILGAGFGGLELASRLAEEVPDEAEVVLIDKEDSFVFGFSKLAVMFGHKSPDEVRMYYRDIAKPGVSFRQEAIESIDPTEKRVVTSGGTYDADVLVIALGADVEPSATPGLVEGGYDFYSRAGAERLREVLPTFTSGKAVIAILGPVFKCPPAPIEAAFLLHDFLSERGVREAVTIEVLSPLPAPITVSPESSEAVLAGFAERGLVFRPKTVVHSLDPGSRVATLTEGGSVDYDLLLAVPIHRAPAVVEEAGLTEEGWIPVDTGSFATRFPDVYAIGDVSTANVPRAGVFAEGQARAVAAQLVARFRGDPPPPPYTGSGYCYLEFGGGTVAKVDVDFAGGPPPKAVFNPPTRERAAEKEEFSSSRRSRWFG